MRGAMAILGQVIMIGQGSETVTKGVKVRLLSIEDDGEVGESDIAMTSRR